MTARHCSPPRGEAKPGSAREGEAQPPPGVPSQPPHRDAEPTQAGSRGARPLPARPGLGALPGGRGGRLRLRTGGRPGSRRASDRRASSSRLHLRTSANLQRRHPHRHHRAEGLRLRARARPCSPPAAPGEGLAGAGHRRGVAAPHPPPSRGEAKPGPIREGETCFHGGYEPGAGGDGGARPLPGAPRPQGPPVRRGRPATPSRRTSALPRPFVLPAETREPPVRAEGRGIAAQDLSPSRGKARPGSIRQAEASPPQRDAERRRARGCGARPLPARRGLRALPGGLLRLAHERDPATFSSSGRSMCSMLCPRARGRPCNNLLLSAVPPTTRYALAYERDPATSCRRSTCPSPSATPSRASATLQPDAVEAAIKGLSLRPRARARPCNRPATSPRSPARPATPSRASAALQRRVHRICRAGLAATPSRARATLQLPALAAGAMATCHALAQRARLQPAASPGDGLSRSRAGGAASPRRA